jgi:hypothetical protein
VRGVLDDPQLGAADALVHGGQVARGALVVAAAGAMEVTDWKRTSRSPMAPRARVVPLLAMALLLRLFYLR